MIFLLNSLILEEHMEKELAQLRQEEERHRVVGRGGSSPFPEPLAGGKRLMCSYRWR
ncbi:MAG TPA: hypothetical protein VNA24_31345 [Hyalangium sp.]|nr:hypothetical protein [Hyalangium sp.]